MSKRDTYTLQRFSHYLSQKSYWISAIVLLIVIIALWLWTLKIGLIHIENSKINSLSQLGCFFGILNTLFAGIALLGVSFSIFTQLKALDYTKEQLDSQQEAQKAQDFNTLFFSLFNYYNNTKNSLSGGKKCRVTGIATFNQAKLDLEAATQTVKTEAEKEKKAAKNSAESKKQQAEKANNCFANYDQKLADILNDDFSFECYARSLEQLIATTLDHEEDNNKYKTIINRSISIEEQVVLLFFGANPKFEVLRDYIEKNSLLSDLNLFNIELEKLPQYSNFSASAFSTKN